MKFVEGKHYIVSDKFYRGKYAEKSDCEYIYRGKIGRHHYFVHAKGAWSMTQTDAQLIGKFVEGVKKSCRK